MIESFDMNAKKGTKNKTKHEYDPEMAKRNDLTRKERNFVRKQEKKFLKSLVRVKIKQGQFLDDLAKEIKEQLVAQYSHVPFEIDIDCVLKHVEILTEKRFVKNFKELEQEISMKMTHQDAWNKLM